MGDRSETERRTEVPNSVTDVVRLCREDSRRLDRVEELLLCLSSKPLGSTTGAVVRASRALGFHNTLFLEKTPLPPFGPDVGDEAFVMLGPGAPSPLEAAGATRVAQGRREGKRADRLLCQASRVARRILWQRHRMFGSAHGSRQTGWINPWGLICGDGNPWQSRLARYGVPIGTLELSLLDRLE